MIMVTVSPIALALMQMIVQALALMQMIVHFKYIYYIIYSTTVFRSTAVCNPNPSSTLIFFGYIGTSKLYILILILYFEKIFSN
jgi:hypothetical protein